MPCANLKKKNKTQIEFNNYTNIIKMLNCNINFIKVIVCI